MILQRTRQKPCLPRVFGVVAVNIDDEQSLIKAFDVSYTIRVQQMSGNVTLNISDLMQGVQAIFAGARFWEHMFIGKDAVQSRDIEVEQGIMIATAAFKTYSLKHYVWSSLSWWQEDIRRRQDRSTSLRLQGCNRRTHHGESTRIGKKDHIPLSWLLCVQLGLLPVVIARSGGMKSFE